MTPADFESAIASHRKALMGIAHRILREQDAVEDAVQIGLMRAWKFRDSFRGDCQLSTWMGHLVANAAFSILRQYKVQRRNDHMPIMEFLIESPVNVARDVELSNLDKWRRGMIRDCPSLSMSERNLVQATMRGERLENTASVRLTRFRAVQKLKKYVRRAA